MKRLKLQAGAELVEFALVLPLLLLVVFGIVDFSLALFDKAVITNAAREGARAGVVFKDPLPTWAELQTEASATVTNYCSAHLISFGASTISTTLTPLVDVSPAGPSSGDTVSVTVQYSYDYVMLSKFIPSLGSLNLSSTSRMRYE